MPWPCWGGRCYCIKDGALLPPLLLLSEDPVRVKELELCSLEEDVGRNQRDNETSSGDIVLKSENILPIRP